MPRFIPQYQSLFGAPILLLFRRTAARAAGEATVADEDFDPYLVDSGEDRRRQAEKIADVRARGRQ